MEMETTLKLKILSFATVYYNYSSTIMELQQKRGQQHYGSTAQLDELKQWVGNVIPLKAEQLSKFLVIDKVL